MLLPVRLVLDTNVLISALLKPGSVPDRLLSAIWRDEVLVVYDARIAREYTQVAGRKKFRAVPRARIAATLTKLLERGRRLEVVAPWDGVMIDEDDRMFVEVALAAGAQAIVTGNTKHFPDDLEVAVSTPAAQLAQLTRLGRPTDLTDP